jgi:hypothetical protein
MGKRGKEQGVHRDLKAHFLRHVGQKKDGRQLVVRKELIPTLERLALRPESFGDSWTSSKEFPGDLPVRWKWAAYLLRSSAAWFYDSRDNLYLPAKCRSFFHSSGVFEPDAYEELLEKMAQSITIISKATSKADTLAFGRAILR